MIELYGIDVTIGLVCLLLAIVLHYGCNDENAPPPQGWRRFLLVFLECLYNLAFFDLLLKAAFVLTLCIVGGGHSI
jgi:hypothetical protein